MKQKFHILYFLLIFFSNIYFVLNVDTASKKASIKEQISNTGLLADREEETLFIATLDGTLHAVTKTTGSKKWILKEDPVIHNPSNSDQPPVPRFFPNPKDGSLYRYTAGRGEEPLKKLPFTIPELVANSPCRSNDGIFYIGKKVDSWVGVDSVTGHKQLVLGTDAVEKVCPKPSRHTIYLGRTLYNIVLFELHTGHKWNVSFYHYNSNSASTQLDNYELVHYTATGEGSILTVDQKTGAPLWNIELESPVVAMYFLDPDGALMSIPITTVTPQTLERFSFNLKELSQIGSTESSDSLLIKELSPTIFVGETENGVYALPAFVDTHTARISRRKSQLLLDGPPGQQGILSTGEEQDRKEGSDVLLLGYYDLPDSLQNDLNTVSEEELGSLNDSSIPLGITHNMNNTSHHTGESEENHFLFWDGWRQIMQLNTTFIVSADIFRWSTSISQLSYVWLFSDPINFIVVLLAACLGLIIVLLYKQAKEYARLSREVSSRRQTSSRGSNGGGGGGDVTANAEELDDGSIKVGKIIFSPQHLLGKGCDGTFVYRGSFDGRKVAVKRILPGCFTVADREVELLRESDQHPNVIRYFCMEQCREFRYIALELCAASLEEMVSGRFTIEIPPLVLLQQATAGLHHLHTLDIVHRDIKPQNVLLSIQNSKGEVRAMISDFGLCKRLEFGRMSFSKRSGVTGTEGWIAPEMLTTSRPTTKVDIFSLGCVYYYVLSKGKHPFGSILDRQSNIISGKHDLDGLDKEKYPLCRSLIEKMINSGASERPPTAALLSHPLFWTPDKILQFFQDVSDRVEKETVNSLVVINLEWDNVEVVKDDWMKHMHPGIEDDLRKFREYKGRSVRDLLRALRNKKNHYRELSDEARRVFGRIPEEFVPYWTSRFPRLLLHTWYAMQCCKLEPIFNKYYFAGYNFRLESLHEMVSLSPNNRPMSSNPSADHEGVAVAPTTAKRRPSKKKDMFDIFDSILGPPTKKGPRNPPKHDKEGASALWVLRRPENTFEPQFEKITKPPLAEECVNKGVNSNPIKDGDSLDQKTGN